MPVTWTERARPVAAQEMNTEVPLTAAQQQLRHAQSIVNALENGNARKGGPGMALTDIINETNYLLHENHLSARLQYGGSSKALPAQLIQELAEVIKIGPVSAEGMFTELTKTQGPAR